MKIGVIGVGFNCHKHLNEVLAPWLSVKCGIYEEGGELVVPPLEGHEFVIAVTSAPFKEYVETGSLPDNEPTKKILKAYHNAGIIDYVTMLETPIIDFESRQLCWEFLQNQRCDITWQLDLYDEFYTHQQIKKILEYIQRNNLVDWYGVNFKNYVGDEKHWIEGFCPPRIHWVRKHWGIKRFYWDNEVEYECGEKSPQLSNLKIPIGVAFVKHLSWCGDPEFLKRKIAYQHKCLGWCSYRWNEELGKIEFDPDYFKKTRQPIPPLNKDE